jgi:adenine-specific DNA-methyltransferase
MAKKQIEVEALRHKDKRRNIPTAELEPVMDEKDKAPIRKEYKRRNRDLDPQLVWRGKDEQDWSDLIVQAPPLYIQEKVHPKVLIDDLLRQSKVRRDEAAPPTPDLFADFNGLPDKEAVAEFYQHDANWSNRMILGDSLAVMASLAEREGLRRKVQCIYIDPPYGIRFNSNFQWSTTSRDVKDGNKDHITREPEQVRAFRDTWRDGIHSYLTYLRDRLTVARELLADGSNGGYSGSIFVQIGDENVHRVRALMDEVFGDENLVSQITVSKTSGQTAEMLPNVTDHLLWYCKHKDSAKYRPWLLTKEFGGAGTSGYGKVQQSDGVRRGLTSGEKRDPSLLLEAARIYATGDLTSQRPPGDFPVEFEGRVFRPRKGHWKTHSEGFHRLRYASRLELVGNTLRYVRFIDDFGAFPLTNIWGDTGVAGFTSDKRYIVETSTKIVERCVLMTTDPGDLVLDPTCGSGTTAYVAEQWGRRWITIDTSRVALALARARIMGARYSYYLLADSPEGLKKEGEVSRTPPKETPTHGDIRHGFVYERVPHITLKSIANNAEIDVIWEQWQKTLEPLRAQLNAMLGRSSPSLRGGEADEAISSGSPRHSAPRDNNLPWEEWEIPREAGSDWPEEATKLHGEWWTARIARQKEIDTSISAKAEFEYLYDKPYPDSSRIRVAGPFTVESLSPHRYVAGDADDSLINELAEPGAGWEDFGQMVLENLRAAGVQQAHKEDRITFTALNPLAGQIDLRRRALQRRRARAADGSPDRPRIRHRVAARSRRCRTRGGRCWL